MKNLINWMCLFSIMGLVLQVMFYINSEVVKEFNKIKHKKINKVKTDRSVGNTKIKRNNDYYQQKIAK